MRKLYLSTLVLLSIVFSANALEEGDTVYVYIGGINKPSTLFSTGSSAYYAEINIERVSSKKVKGYISKICRRASNSRVYCNTDRKHGYGPGDCAWFYKSELYSWVP